MIEFLVILSLLCFITYQQYEFRRERDKLINAIIAKNAAELANLQFADKVKVEAGKTEDPTPDLTPVDQLTEEEFDKYILQHAT